MEAAQYNYNLFLKNNNQKISIERDRSKIIYSYIQSHQDIPQKNHNNNKIFQGHQKFITIICSCSSFQNHKTNSQTASHTKSLNNMEQMDGSAEMKYGSLYKQHQSSAAQGVSSFNQLNVKIIEAKDVNPHNLSAYDYQGINWLEIARIPRDLYIRNRLITYEPYREHKMTTLIKYQQPNRVANSSYFQIERFYQGLKPKNSHFQLRECVQVVSHHDIFYMGNERLNHVSTLKHDLKHYETMNNSNVQDWEALRNFRIASFSVDEESFALGGFNGGLYYQNLTSQKSFFLKNITNIIGETINYIKLYKQGNSQMLITAQNDNCIQIFDVEHYYQPKQKIICANPVNVAKLNPLESDLLAVFTDQEDPEFIDLRSNQIVATLKGHQDFGLALDWNPNGRQFASGNSDGTTRIWDIRNLSEATHVLQSNMGNISSLKYDSSGSYLVAMECSDYLNIYDVFSDYKDFQVVDYVGLSTGFDIYQDKIFVGVHLNDYNGILELKKNKNNNFHHQMEFESCNI